MMKIRKLAHRPRSLSFNKANHATLMALITENHQISQNNLDLGNKNFNLHL